MRVIDKLEEFANNVFSIAPIGKRENANILFSKKDVLGIVEDEEFKSINKFVFFTMNYPQDFVRKAFPNNSHIENKWIESYNKKGSYGAMTYFYLQLDENNRKKLVKWMLENYKA